jgi:hypothetical protein
MRPLVRCFIVTIAAIALIAGSADANAGDHVIRIVLVKAGRLLSGYGSASLFYNGRRYRLNIGGVNVDTLPEPRISIVGTVSNVRSRADIIGTYRAAEGSSSIISATMGVRLENERRVNLQLDALPGGSKVSVDLAGLTIGPRR